MQLTVNLGARSYPITLENGAAAELPTLLKATFPKSRFAIITNTTIAALYRDLIIGWEESLDCAVHEMPDGERYKNIDSWSNILNFLITSRLERSSIVIALGGGVVGDVTGFAAASFLRGIGFIQVPTTLLAMVDSSVGGKTAVDHPLGKNLIGAFHQPKMVCVDSTFLSTLPDRDFISGYAELFKNAFIGGREIFDFVRSNHHAMIAKDMPVLLDGIARSIAVKAGIVEKDEFETSGLRALLNFGHTFAHAIERYFNFEDVLHGEALWWGMRCAVDCARRSGLLGCEAGDDYQEMVDLMPKPPLPGKPDPAALYSMMHTDKKIIDGKIRLVLPTIPGVSVVRNDIPKAVVKMTITSVFG